MVNRAPVARPTIIKAGGFPVTKQLTVRGVISEPQVARVLVGRLSRLQPGGSTVRVETASGTTVTLRAVPLERSGTELVKTTRQE